MLVCLATAGSLSLSSRPGASSRDRDHAVRLTRSGFYRLDSPDAILHSHEETEPDAAFSGLVVGQPPGATDLSAADAPDGVGVADARTLVALPRPDASTALRLQVSSPAPAASPPNARPPGRAPPFTA